MNKLTVDMLKFICPQASNGNLMKYINHLNDNFEKYDINTSLRLQHFIAQVAHESCQFLFCKELASGKAYEGRKDLGNTNIGDGIKFKGRGLIQITGKCNYDAISNDLFGDSKLLRLPEVLETPEYAVISALWFWNKHGLNEIADTDNCEKITKKINGGVNGLTERKEFLRKAKIYIK